ncbi:MAG: phosphoglycerate dehydrogenase [SAR324 cluster bacterium]|nr:phosphoglycerate dehydrogenase [SAR324 cluster bacterium]
MLPVLKSLSKIKVLLLENIAPSAIDTLKSYGINKITQHKGSYSNKELKIIIKDYHVLGIRSRTHLSGEVLNAANKFSTIGCFCIGTNQVDLVAARELGVPVFNAPYSNTRSVAELAICHIISLFRQISVKHLAILAGVWDKSANGCYEIRGKTLGIVGYGHIGKQLGAIAESLGMNVFYYDTLRQLSLGNAKALKSLKELLKISDVVSLHVPDNDSTKNMITRQELAIMKKGSYLINLSRGSVVSIDDLSLALESKHIAGAALDVFPAEPDSKEISFDCLLNNTPNVILTPHIAGSTEEAQVDIGQDVANKLANFLMSGSTIDAVNFARLNVPPIKNCMRFIHIHKNMPGMLTKINDVFSSLKVNILGQYLQTHDDIGYGVIDADVKSNSSRLAIKEALRSIKHTVRSYSIY